MKEKNKELKQNWNLQVQQIKNKVKSRPLLLEINKVGSPAISEKSNKGQSKRRKKPLT